LTDPTDTRPLVLHARVVTGTGGGPDKTILNSPRFLQDLGYQAICVYLYPEGDPGIESLRQRAEDSNAEFIAIPDRGVTDLRVIRKLSALCRDRNVSVWHAHDYKTDALGLLVRRKHPVKLVSTVHGWVSHSKRTPLYHAIDRAALRRYDRIICVSDVLFSECVSANIPIDRCSEIANGIDLQHYDFLNREAARQELGLTNNRFVIGALGRLSHEKGFDNLISAFEHVLESGLDAELLIAGSGPDKDRLSNQIAASQHSSRIRLVGHQEDPRPFYTALDAFVISSRSEGLPNVLLESMACRIPTVATRVGGIPTVVEHERDALLVEADDVEALAVSMTRLAHNPALCEELARNGRSTLEERYSFEVRMKKIAAVYDDVLCLAADTPRLNAEIAQASGDGDIDASDGESIVDSSDLVADTSRFSTNSDAAATLLEKQVASERVRPAVNRHVKTAGQIQVEVTTSAGQWSEFLDQHEYAGFHQRAEWTNVLKQGMKHQTVCLQATSEDRIVGVLPLTLIKSRLFGRFLVSLPYLNTSGIVARDDRVAHALVDHAIHIADLTDVRYLELRHETPVDHPRLTQAVTDKVHMRLALPDSAEKLWDGLKSKVRSQIRKPLKNEGFEVTWGGEELLDAFYAIFCQNMRDLGTPPFSRRLFAAMLSEFTGDAELCVVRLNNQPVASAVLIHGPGVTEVPSASSLRQFNSSNANMLMYLHLLQRAIERGQHTFDFGRSSTNSGTYRFKSQWGATASPAVWQHYVRKGSATDMRPNSGKYDLMINVWKKLPVWLTKVIGPSIVRGIP
jgi:serine/alanine adding enzyme